jgi:hypothetical protein
MASNRAARRKPTTGMLTFRVAVSIDIRDTLDTRDTRDTRLQLFLQPLYRVRQ